MSKRRISAQAGYVDHRTLPKGPTGRPLCRQCQEEVPAGRRSFCSQSCIHSWQLKTNTGYVRQCVYARDKGVCRQCGCDTNALKLEYAQFIKDDYAARQAALRAQGIWIMSGSQWSGHQAELHSAAAEWCLARGIPVARSHKSWWDADHIVPVAEGGGECDLANYQTLCLKCHKAKTAEQARRRALARRIPPLFH